MKEWFASVSKAVSGFVIRICFVIRHSDFVIFPHSTFGIRHR